MLESLSIWGPWWIIGACIVLGACLGSFLNVVIYRLPIMMERAWSEQNDEGGDPGKRFNLLIPASTCPHCKASIPPWFNIPIFSFLLLRGKCANCQARISWRYPIIEMIGAAIPVVALFSAESISVFFGILIFSYAMVALFFIDLEHYLLPDIITLPLLWIGLLFNLDGHPVALQDAVLGAVIGYSALWILFQLFKLLTGKEGLGFGDFKLVAAIGAWLGWQFLPLVILLGSISGAIIGGLYLALSGRGRDHPIPFGPFLALAGWIALLWGEQIVSGYLQFAGF